MPDRPEHLTDERLTAIAGIDWKGCRVVDHWGELATSLAAEVLDLRPRTIDSADGIADQPTGTVIRSRHGDIGSVDHGGNGEWVGAATLVHLLGPGGGLTVGDLKQPDLASSFPWTVLWGGEQR